MIAWTSDIMNFYKLRYVLKPRDFINKSLGLPYCTDAIFLSKGTVIDTSSHDDNLACLLNKFLDFVAIATKKVFAVRSKLT